MCLWLIIADMIQTESLRDMNKAQGPVVQRPISTNLGLNF